MYGDDTSLQRGGTRVLVSGGSATAAWNCTQARAVGAVDVDWIAEDRQPDKQPSSAQGKRDWQALQDKLNAGVSIADVPAEEKALRAFDAAKLPRNVGGADAAFNDPKIHRSVNGIKQVTPTQDLHDPNIAPGRVKVVFSDGSFGIYDRKAGRLARDERRRTGWRSGAGRRPPVPARRQRRHRVRAGKHRSTGCGEGRGRRDVERGVLGRESIPATLDMPDPMDSSKRILARDLYQRASREQSSGAPRDSPANPLVHNVVKQLDALSNGN